MNAISPPPTPAPAPTAATARTERHLAACQRLAELGLSLAEAAHARALQDLATTPPPPEPPAVADAEPNPATPRTDPALTFIRASHATRQAITLEARLATEATENTSHPRQPFRYAYSAPPDPRRPKLQRALKAATHAQDLPAATQRAITDRMDDALLYDPNHDILVGDLFASICKDLGIEPDLSRVEDEILIITPPHLVAPDGSLYPPDEWPELEIMPFGRPDG